MLINRSVPIADNRLLWVQLIKLISGGQTQAGCWVGCYSNNYDEQEEGETWSQPNAATVTKFTMVEHWASLPAIPQSTAATRDAHSPADVKLRLTRVVSKPERSPHTPRANGLLQW